MQFSSKEWISDCSSKERHLLAIVPVCFALSLYPPFDPCPLFFFVLFALPRPFIPPLTHVLFLSLPPPPLSSPCIAVHESALLRGIPPSLWGTQSIQCLPSTAYPPHHALGSSPLFFFNQTGACSSVSSTKNNFLKLAAANFLMAFFFQFVKRHCLQGWCLGGVQGILCRVWGAREDAQAPHSQGE